MKIASFDFDLTITSGQSGIEYVARRIGIFDQVKEIEDAFAAGCITTKQFSEQTAHFFKGLNRDHIHGIAREIPTLQKIKQAISLLNSNGYICCINTLTYDFIVTPFMEMYDFTFVTGVQMGIDDRGVLSGEILTYFTPDDKVNALKKWAADRNTSIQYLVAIGDSSGDIPIFRHADHSIALNHCKEAIIDLASEHLVTNDALDIAHRILDLEAVRTRQNITI